MKLLVIAACLINVFEKTTTVTGWPETGDESFRKYIQESLRNFKETMKKGFPALEIPVLEPYSVDNIIVIRKDDYFDVTLSMRDLQIFGLSGYEVQKIDSNLKNMRLVFIMYIPRITISSDQYHLNGRLFRIFPLTGNGKMRLEAHKVAIKMNTTLELNFDSSLSINTIETDLDFQSVDIKLDNFLGGGSFGNAMTQLLSSLGKTIFDKFKPQIESALEDSLRKSIDSKLPKITELYIV